MVTKKSSAKAKKRPASKSRAKPTIRNSKPPAKSIATIHAHRSGDSVYIEEFVIPENLRRKKARNGATEYARWEASLPKDIKLVRLHAADMGSGSSEGFWERMGFDWRYDYGESIGPRDRRYEHSREMVKGVNGHPTPPTVVIDEDDDE